MEKFSSYLKEELNSEENIRSFIDAALEQYFIDHNKELFLLALKEVIKAKGGVSKISKEAHINRQHVYKMLSNKGNPSFDNIGFVLSALGLRLRVESEPSKLAS